MKPHIFCPYMSNRMYTYIYHTGSFMESLDPLRCPSSAKVQGLGAQKKHRNAPQKRGQQFFVLPAVSFQERLFREVQQSCKHLFDF